MGSSGSGVAWKLAARGDGAARRNQVRYHLDFLESTHLAAGTEETFRYEEEPGAGRRDGAVAASTDRGAKARPRRRSAVGDGGSVSLRVERPRRARRGTEETLRYGSMRRPGVARATGVTSRRSERPGRGSRAASLTLPIPDPRPPRRPRWHGKGRSKTAGTVPPSPKMEKAEAGSSYSGKPRRLDRSRAALTTSGAISASIRCGASRYAGPATASAPTTFRV